MVLISVRDPGENGAMQVKVLNIVNLVVKVLENWFSRDPGLPQRPSPSSRNSSGRKQPLSGKIEQAWLRSQVIFYPKSTIYECSDTTTM
jgi:hypothetical protein